MENNISYVGLDVHAANIAVAVAESTGEVRSAGTTRRLSSHIPSVLNRKRVSSCSDTLSTWLATTCHLF